MKTMFIGIDITDKQYKTLKKSARGGPVQIAFPALVGADFMGRAIRFSDLRYAHIVDGDQEPILYANPKDVKQT